MTSRAGKIIICQPNRLSAAGDCNRLCRFASQATGCAVHAFARVSQIEFKMAKLSQADKMKIQKLREQGLGTKAIKAAYPLKHCSLETLKTICRRIYQLWIGSAVNRKAGS